MPKKATPDTFSYKHLPNLLATTYKAWDRDDPWRLSAVVAYYALLALPGLLVIIINVVGAIWGEEIVQGEVTRQIASAIGQDAANAVRVIIRESTDQNKSLIATIIGIGTLVFGATGVFYHLQISINQIWEIKPAPGAGFKKILLDRALSFAFVLTIGFLLLVSFIITAAISTLNEYIRQILPDFTVYFAMGLNELVSFGIITLLFALMYRFMPDARIHWRTVWVGAIITAFLFILGKFLMGLYFGESNPASAYGAAGSVVLILLWVSYSSLIFFFGAEFTYVFSKRYGYGIKPKPHSWHVKKKEEVVDRGEESKTPKKTNGHKDDIK